MPTMPKWAAEPTHIDTDVLVIGAGGAGMYAAIAAAREGANVLLVDKNMVGRGGATIMAQMTVAAALDDAGADSWQRHLEDTLTAGRELCDENLAATLCRAAPDRIREMDDWGVGWARVEGRINLVTAPGHGRRRCCYVDFLNTGPAVAATLRKRIGKEARITRVSNLAITDFVVTDHTLCGAQGVSLRDATPVNISASSGVVATGGLTKIYARSSASNNMAGEGYALALRAGAELVDMEFVQFFPIGHLAPRLVGMDPIMWDPFRYKLGGRLLNGRMEEFIDRYGGEDDGRYTATRDLATYAICREVEAHRGSPSGGAYLSFTHLPERELRDAFGPVIDRLLANGIDLTRSAIEVSPIAHYHMGGIRVDEKMRSSIAGLYAAGEAVGGAGGANRLSGNAITEALVFGEVAGREAGAHAVAVSPRPSCAAGGLPTAPPGPLTGSHRDDGCRPVAMMAELKRLMWQFVGPFRTESGLRQALDHIRSLRRDELDGAPHRSAGDGNRDGAAFCVELFDWYELRSALWVAEAVALAALARTESRGAHQRDDYPETSAGLAVNQVISMAEGGLRSSFAIDSRIDAGILR